MHKRSTVFLALIAVLALGACSLAAAPEPPPAAGADAAAPSAEAAPSATITFGGMSFMRHVYEPLIAAFNTQHPGITVQWVSLDPAFRGEQGDRIRQVASLADTAAIELGKEQLRPGLLYDLRPLIEADASFERDDYYPSALGGAADAPILMLPQSLSAPLLFYNQDLWALRGLSAPKPDWTWQEVAAAAQQLAQRQGGAVAVYGLADKAAHAAVLLAELKSAGLDLAAAPPGSAQVDRPEIVAALQRVADLFSSGAFYLPSQAATDPKAVAQLISSQEVAIWGPQFAGVLADAQPGKGAAAPSFGVGVAVAPPSPIEGQGFGRGYVMSSGTQHAGEAWAWLSFLSKQLVLDPGDPVAASELPARKSLAEQSGYWSRMDGEARAAVEAALARPAPAVPSTGVLDAYELLFRAVEEIVAGKSAAQAAGEAQAAIAERTAQAQLAPTAAPNTEPIVVATPVPNVAPADATTITFGMPLPKGDDQVSRLVQEFNQSGQGVFVQLKDTFTGRDFLSAPAAAAQTDCFASPLPPAQSELSATLDLQPLIDADASFQPGDYPTALLAPYRQGGQLHGLPWGINLRVLLYNQDLFEAAGLQPPSAAWTMDDLLNAAQRLTSGQGDTRQYGLVIPRSTPEAAKFLVHLFGAATARGSGETLEPNFADPKVLEAARKVLDLLKSATPHAQLEGDPADYGPLTSEGRAGMWFAWGMYAYGPEQPQFTMAMAPPPLGQAALDPDDVSTSGLYISAQTDKQQACWAWLAYISSHTVGGAGGNIPVRRSAAHSEALNQQQPGLAAVYDAYAAALERGAQTEAGREPIDYRWFYQALDHGLQGKNLEQELARAQGLTEQHLACVRSGGEARACVQQVDP